MSRNASGTHSLPAGNPVVTGTAISSTVQNATLSDLSAEITDSLSRSGKGGMTSPLRCADGSVSAPAHSFTSETGTGFYRAGAGDLRASVLGVDRFTLTATAAALTKPLAMGSNKITGLANGSAATDAAAFGQVPALTEAALTAGTGWALNGSLSKVYKYGRFVMLKAEGSYSGVGAAMASLATVPAGYFPQTVAYFTGIYFDNGVGTYSIRGSVNGSNVLNAIHYIDTNGLMADATTITPAASDTFSITMVYVSDS